MKIFKEAKEQTPYYRKVMGVLSISVGLLMAILDLLSKLETSEAIILVVMGTGMTLLGIGNITDIWKK